MGIKGNQGLSRKEISTATHLVELGLELLVPLLCRVELECSIEACIMGTTARAVKVIEAFADTSYVVHPFAIASALLVWTSLGSFRPHRLILVSEHSYESENLNDIGCNSNLVVLNSVSQKTRSICYHSSD